MPRENYRVAVAALVLSAPAFVALLTHEGYSERAYPDPTRGAALPTAGFGTTGPDITMSTRLPPVQAAQRALRDVATFEGAVRQCIHVPLSQGEYDSFLSFSYNAGAAAFCRSGMAREINAGNYRAACDQMLRWRFSNGQDCSAPGNRTCRGLWTRRQAEHAQCINAVEAAGG